MSDKVEAFLANLPLLNVKNKTISGHDEQVVTEFPDGDVIKTAWRTRDAPTSATAWSYLVDSDEQVLPSAGYPMVPLTSSASENGGSPALRDEAVLSCPVLLVCGRASEEIGLGG